MLLVGSEPPGRRRSKQFVEVHAGCPCRVGEEPADIGGIGKTRSTLGDIERLNHLTLGYLLWWNPRRFGIVARLIRLEAILLTVRLVASEYPGVPLLQRLPW